MKKFVLGLIVGIAVTATSSVYADDIIQSVVGKSIEGEMPIKVSGKQLSTQAIIVDGTSYLPVRAAGEALNMDVKFDSTAGIELQQKGANMTVPFDKEALRIRLERNNRILELRNQQKVIQDEITPLYNIVSLADMKKKTDPNFEYGEDYYVAKQAWEDKKAELVEIDNQIAAIQ